jgi:NTE family protein
MRRVAVVLSGGGGKGAYHIGVLKALERLNIEPDIYTGTSVGSFNAAMLVSGKSLEQAERIWLGLTDTDVFLTKFNPRSLLTARSTESIRLALESIRSLARLIASGVMSGKDWWRTLDLDSMMVDSSPMEYLIARSVDVASLKASKKSLCVPLTRLKPVTDDPLEILCNDRISHRHIFAACSAPLIFPPVSIGDQTFCDGAVIMNHPLKPAIDAGADDLYLVDLTPPPQAYDEHTLPLAYQVMSAQFSAMMRRDLAFARDRNSQFLAAFKERRLIDGRLEVSRVENRPGPLGEITRRRYRYIRLYVIKPSSDLGGIEGFLKFESGYTAELIAQGERDALGILSRYYVEALESPAGERMEVVRSPEDQVDPDLAQVTD